MTPHSLSSPGESVANAEKGGRGELGRAPRDARRMAATQLSITIPGFSDQTGHTEYIIKSSVGDQQFSVQHRFSNFVELHDALASKIAKLPATFPVAKNMFNGEAVKRERVEKLQEYLRNVVRLSSEKPPIALLKFLRIDASVFAPPSERSRSRARNSSAMDS